MTKIAVDLQESKYTLRSGGAPGADTAFELGAINKEIYIPWQGFNNSTSELYSLSQEATDIAKSIHTAFNRCTQGAQKLHTRNVYQILGYDLKSPSEFVVCWTKNGKTIGGTATAINLAVSLGIPVYNLAVQKDYDRFINYISNEWE
jgi:hypothetical protein